MPKITFKNKIKQILDILYYGNNDFFEDLEYLNLKYSQDFREDLNLKDAKSKDMYDLIRDINWFLKKYRLSKLYFNPILNFILYKDFKIDSSVEKYPIKFIKGIPRGADERSFYLEIYPETTREDILAVWNDIKNNIQNNDILVPGKQKLKEKKLLIIKYLTIAEEYAKGKNKKLDDKRILLFLKNMLPKETENLSYYDIPKLRLLRKKMASKLS